MTITTAYKNPKRAAIDLVQKINNDPFVQEMGDHAEYFERDGVPMIGLDFAFESAIGFTLGLGLYGCEGFGPCGPVLDYRHTAALVECEDSVTLSIFER